VAATWPELPSYNAWSDTCDTLHAHTQVLGKIALALAPPEPELQHAALRVTARGWETALLPAAEGAGALVAGLDLRRHEAVVEHGDGRTRYVPLTPDRPVAEVSRDLLAALADLSGAPVRINPTPQEVPWTVPLDEDEEHGRYDEAAVAAYHAAATRAALALAALRAPYRGRSTPVNAWWGGFDLSVALLSGRPAEPPARDFITRNAMDAEHIAVGWWPGDGRYQRPAFYAFAHPAVEGIERAPVEPAAARFDTALGEYLLDWEDVRGAPDPQAEVLAFGRSVFRHYCGLCEWDPLLAGSAEGRPAPIV